ncbi:TOLL-like receptor [Chamberlinius hualienensis]
MRNRSCKIVNKFNPTYETTLSANMLCESTYNDSDRLQHTKHGFPYKIYPSFNFLLDFFQCPYPCYCYSTDNFSLAHIYCSKFQLQFPPDIPKSYRIHVKLEITVWLDGNYLNNLLSENLTEYQNVRQLYLNSSNITSIDESAFQFMRKLKMLDLSHNHLTIIQEGTFNWLTNLRKLYLNHNKILQLPDNCFNYSTSLKSLRLHNNNLNNFPIWNLIDLNFLNELTIHNNSWSCDCNFIIAFRDYFKYNIHQIANESEIYCVYDNGTISNTSVIMYDISQCKVSVNYMWQIISGVLGFLSIIAIATGVIYNFKSSNSDDQTELKYSVMKNTGTPLETEGKAFDIFISYSNKDSDFVVDELIPNLEHTQNPYHVCVHERNFLVGGTIEDTILEAIRKSTRIVVVLTENYLCSTWCMYEFKAAHAQMLEDQCPRVVLIIKDDIPDDIDPNFKLYLATNTYVKWKDDVFWKRLKFALPSTRLPIQQTHQPLLYLMPTT